MEESVRAKRPVTKKSVGFKLSFLGVSLLKELSNYRVGTPLAEKMGPMLDRLILQEAQSKRNECTAVDVLLKGAGL